MKMFRIAAAAAVALLAAGCLLTPGKFDSGMTVRKDGTFTYRYVGEIVLTTGHTMMAAAAEADANAEFDPESEICWEGDPLDSDDPQTRECTAEEIEAAREAWEQGRGEREEKAKRDAAAMKAMLGGIDPTDPKTMDAFAARLQTYEGWKRVVHKGNGVFDIHYEISGRLDHDFVYPVFPDIEYILPFVQVTRRTDGKVRIVAPAFVQGTDGPFDPAGMGTAVQGMEEASQPGSLKKPEGTFTLTTDGEILTNNTNDGPSTAGGMKVLKWTVGPLDAKKPEALIQL